MLALFIEAAFSSHKIPPGQIGKRYTNFRIVSKAYDRPSIMEIIQSSLNQINH